MLKSQIAMLTLIGSLGVVCTVAAQPAKTVTLDSLRTTYFDGVTKIDKQTITDLDALVEKTQTQMADLTCFKMATNVLSIFKTDKEIAVEVIPTNSANATALYRDLVGIRSKMKRDEVDWLTKYIDVLDIQQRIRVRQKKIQEAEAFDAEIAARKAMLTTLESELPRSGKEAAKSPTAGEAISSPKISLAGLWHRDRKNMYFRFNDDGTFGGLNCGDSGKWVVLGENTVRMEWFTGPAEFRVRACTLKSASEFGGTIGTVYDTYKRVERITCFTCKGTGLVTKGKGQLPVFCPTCKGKKIIEK